MPNIIAQCTPSLGTVSLFWTRMVDSLLWPMGMGKALMYLTDRYGGEIAEVRNAIVQEAIEHDAALNPVTHLFWVDDDVFPMAGALKELLALNADVASGTYVLKEDGQPQPLLWPGEFDEGPLLPFQPNRVFPIKYCGMGLTLVRLCVYRRMRDELDLGTDKYGRPRWYHTAKEGTGDVGLDTATGIVSSGFTEDWWFMHHAAMIGAKAMASTSKNAFGFHTQPLFSCTAEGCGFRTGERKLAARHEDDRGHHLFQDVIGYPKPQWEQWCRGEAVRWPTPAGEVVWE